MTSKDDQSIWDLLDRLESSLIDTFHSTSDLVVPQLIDTSHQLYQHLQSISKQAYDKSIELGSRSDLLNQIIHPTTHTSSNHPSSSSSHISSVGSLTPSTQSLNPNLSTTSHSFIFNLLRPRTFLITTGIYLTSTFTLRLLLSTDPVQHFLRSHPNLRDAIPATLRPNRKRSKPIIRPRYSTGGKTRLEAVIILCADPGTIGYQVSIELASSGYIVIASVSHPSQINPLERDGHGWIKALLLDPNRSELIPTFNRSLASALSLRFPLNSAGDAFMGDGMHSSLVGMINCFPIGTPDQLCPVENLDPQTELLPTFHKTVGIAIEVIKVVLPMIRNSIEKNGGEDGLILTLFPTKTSSVALPYLSSSVIANQSLETLMTSLRRELLISDSPSKHQIRIINERIGLFTPPNPTPRHAQPSPTLPVHLHPIYAPSLSRRLGFLSIPTTHLAVHSANGSPLTHLIRRVKHILQSPNLTRGSSTSVGRQVWVYKLIGTLAPGRAVEMWLSMVEKMNGWVRRRVANEIDLESAETLEQVIGKRQFSVGSGWKRQAFGGGGVGEGVKTDEEILESVEPISAMMDETQARTGEQVIEEGDDGNVDETGSCVDKGEEVEGEVMQESFVGSEINWKADEQEQRSSTPPRAETEDGVVVEEDEKREEESV